MVDRSDTAPQSPYAAIVLEREQWKFLLNVLAQPNSQRSLSDDEVCNALASEIEQQLSWSQPESETASDDDEELPEFIESALGDFVYPDQDSYWEMLPAWIEAKRRGDVVV